MPASAMEEVDLITGISLALPGEGPIFLGGMATEAVGYYIQVKAAAVSLPGSKMNALGTSKQQRLFIDSVFSRLDPILNVDFARQKDKQGSLIDFYSVDNIGGNKANLGMALRQGNKFDLLWKQTSGDNSICSSDKESIVHEVGHALGLRHPFDDPWNPAFTTASTAMSYNTDATMASNPWFSANDLAALVKIWGPETDPVIA
ncbi:hypothetical protein [Synechococcus sp. CS-1328]|uniref:hypothetical protein n=1 Tax=Synechococcus sp. CS-1328 TaxID=2847976 RepID=UPI00223A6939|nr:hypothetical protein [Synechococcus sp. CS-1328]MCT0226405.1 hypothetical protein [Synechococcus sp. CS-1328]